MNIKKKLQLNYVFLKTVNTELFSTIFKLRKLYHNLKSTNLWASLKRNKEEVIAL